MVCAGSTVYTVTLNPALDCYIQADDFLLGSISRYGQPVLLPGGKGINVSLLLSSLGLDTVAIGFLAGFTGRELSDMLKRRGCPQYFSFLSQGLTRVNLKILSKGGQETALNGQGPPVPPQELEQLEQRLATMLRPGDFLVLSGSIPGSMQQDIYPRLARARPQDVRLILDAGGQALRQGLSSKPFLIKPNLEELAEFFAADNLLDEAADQAKRDREILRYARKLQRMGAKNVAVTLGAQGALLLTESGDALRRPALPGRAVSSIGAGDSFVAGFIYGMKTCGDMSGALDWATAAGAATAFSGGLADAEAVTELYKQHFAGKNLS